MDNQLFVANELAAILSAPLAALLSLRFKENQAARLIIFGQLATFIFALAGSVSSYFIAGCNQVAPLLVLSITFLSFIISAFSDRYLAAEKYRLDFLRLLALLSTSSATLCLVDNIFLSFVCWHLLSIGLWLTLRLQPDGKKTANIVFAYHIVSDLILFVSLSSVVALTGVTEFSDLKSVPASLIVLGLIVSFSIKSALYPFHGWLLATLNAPTPLSGLLHAGIVNVSAIMFWRMMPIFNEHTNILLFWGIWSAISAIVGTLSMQAQPDVKRKLVYSTVGQMGFMSLQCASGFVGSALFHLIAHGLFKCHLFLQSGSAVEEGKLKRKYLHASESQGAASKTTKLILIALLLSLFSISFQIGVEQNWVFLSALVTGLAIWSAIPGWDRIKMSSILLFLGAVMLISLFSAWSNNKFEELSLLNHGANAILLPLFLVIAAGLGILLELGKQNNLAKALYVHSLNGFYFNGHVLEVMAKSSKKLSTFKN